MLTEYYCIILTLIDSLIYAYFRRSCAEFKVLPFFHQFGRHRVTDVSYGLVNNVLFTTLLQYSTVVNVILERIKCTLLGRVSFGCRIIDSAPLLIC